MDNGCATVALINIVMNQPEVSLGPLLTAFKVSTAPVSPVERGYILDSHPLIRSAHNVFARRLEHLNADLTLKNVFDEEEGDPDAALVKRNSKLKRQATKNPKRRPSTNASQPPKKKVKPNSEVCHYKAFLFTLGQVWVLDGLEPNPVSLGHATAETWTDLALSTIRAKMDAALGEYFSVLAVCPAPTRRLRNELLANITGLRAARRLLAEQSCGVPPPRQPEKLYWDPDDTDHVTDDEHALAGFGITRTDLEDVGTPAILPTAPAERDEVLGSGVSRDQVHKLEAAQTDLVVAYNTEVMNAESEAERCKERKQDFGAAIHAWVSKLAAKKALQALVEDGG